MDVRPRSRFLFAVALAVVATLGWAGTASALSPDQAEEIAKQKLDTGRYANAVLYRSRLPVPAKSVIASDDVPVNAGDLETVVARVAPFAVPTRADWLFWLDQNTDAEFPHPARLLLVDAVTGAVTLDESMESKPLVNGEPPDLVVVSRSQPESSPSLALPPTGRSVVPEGYSKFDCLVTIGDRSRENNFSGDFVDFGSWASHVGIRSVAMPTLANGVDLRQRVHLLSQGANGCHNFIVVIGGHGSAPPGIGDPHARTTPDPEVNTGYEIVGKPNDPNGFDARVSYVTGPDLEKLLESNPLSTFELVIDSCFSGRFVGYLEAAQRKQRLDNLLLVATSSNANEESYFHVARGVPWKAPLQAPDDALQDLRELINGGETSVRNPEKPRNAPAEGDFVHAFVDALYAWSNDDKLFLSEHDINGNRVPGGLVAGLERAARLAQDNDFTATTLHWTHPLVWIPKRQDVVYRYDVRIAVKDAKVTWSSPNSDGTGTSTWELDYQNVPISIDRRDRTAWVGYSYGGHAITGTGKVNATFQWQGIDSSTKAPYSCSYTTDSTVARGNLPGLLQGNEPLAAKNGSTGDASLSDPHAQYSFAYTGVFGADLQTSGDMFAPVGVSGTYGCTPAAADASIEQLLGVTKQGAISTLGDAPFIGVPCGLGSKTAANGPSQVFAVSAWDIGKSEIDVKPVPIPARNLCGPAYYGTQGIDATVKGTYEITFTRR